MKVGTIITVYKGGKKDKRNPNSYRAITLSSCILKLFEKVLLRRLENNTSLTPHRLQGGFRKGLGCLMSSLSLQECISYANENRSKLYACFLDSRQAFDRVWHQGLVYKLMEAGDIIF